MRREIKLDNTSKKIFCGHFMDREGKKFMPQVKRYQDVKKIVENITKACIAS